MFEMREEKKKQKKRGDASGRSTARSTDVHNYALCAQAVDCPLLKDLTDSMGVPVSRPLDRSCSSRSTAHSL